MLPLSGLKVIDLSRVLAGPSATQVLADLGADVIKVEPPEGDETRSWGPPYFEETSSYYLTVNRNKKSIALNFANSEDHKKLLHLIHSADILVENFKTDSLKKFGLDYESLRPQNPKLIYCSITGFGHTGPLAHAPGYDVLIQAMSGLMSITGSPESGPTKVGVAVTDLMTGLYAAIGILAAVREREKSGLGQALDLALFDVQVSALVNIAMGFLSDHRVPSLLGNRHPSIVPYGSYRTKDSWIMLTIGNDHQFDALSKAMNQTWSSDLRFSKNPERVKNRLSLESLLEGALKEHPTANWLKIFENQGFPFGPIQNLEQVKNHPQTIARELFTTMNDGKTPCLRSPLRFSRTPIEHYQSPPKLNQDSSAEFRSSS